MLPLHVEGVQGQQDAQEADQDPGYSFPPRGRHSQDGRRHRSLAWLETRIHTHACTRKRGCDAGVTSQRSVQERRREAGPRGGKGAGLGGTEPGRVQEHNLVSSSSVYTREGLPDFPHPGHFSPAPTGRILQGFSQARVRDVVPPPCPGTCLEGL